jgi:hypothetical protein
VELSPRKLESVMACRPPCGWQARTVEQGLRMLGWFETGAERFDSHVMIIILYTKRFDTFEMHQIFDPTHPRLLRERWVLSSL